MNESCLDRSVLWDLRFSGGRHCWLRVWSGHIATLLFLIEIEDWCVSKITIRNESSGAYLLVFGANLFMVHMDVSRGSKRRLHLRLVRSIYSVTIFIHHLLIFCLDSKYIFNISHPLVILPYFVEINILKFFVFGEKGPLLDIP